MTGDRDPQRAAFTLLAFVAAWVALAAPFLLPLGAALPVSLGGVVLAVWSVATKRAWLDEDPARALFLLGVLVIGQLTFRPGASVPLSDLFFFGSLVVVLASVAARRRVRIPGPSVLLLAAAALVLAGGGIAALAAASPGGVIGATARLVFVFVVLPWLALQTLERDRHIFAATLAWAVSIAASGVAALAQLVDDDVIPGTTGSWGRMTGFAQHVNDLGSQTAIALVPAVLLVASLPRTRYRRIFWLLPALIFGGLTLSLSLSGFAALLVCAIAFVVLHPTAVRLRVTRRRAAEIGAILAAAMAALVLLPPLAGAPSIIDRVTTTTDPDSPNERGTLWARWRSIEDAWTVIAHEPVTGVGANPEELMVGRDPHIVHSTPLATWAGMGFIAMLGVVAGFAFGAIVAVRAARRAPPPVSALACASAAAFVGYCAFALGNPALFRRHGWIAVALAVAIGHVGRREQLDVSETVATRDESATERGAQGLGRRSTLRASLQSFVRARRDRQPGRRSTTYA